MYFFVNKGMQDNTVSQRVREQIIFVIVLVFLCKWGGISEETDARSKPRPHNRNSRYIDCCVFTHTTCSPIPEVCGRQKLAPAQDFNLSVGLKEYGFDSPPSSGMIIYE